MSIPRAAATELRDAVRGREGFTQSLRGHIDVSSPTYRMLVNGERIALQGIDDGLAAVLKEHESSKMQSDRVTCILRMAMADTWQEYYEQIAQVLSVGVKLYSSRNSSWVFFCTPTLVQFEALQKLSFVAALREFRPEYKYTKERRPGAVFPDLKITGILTLGESQLQDLRDMGFTIKSHVSLGDSGLCTARRQVPSRGAGTRNTEQSLVRWVRVLQRTVHCASDKYLGRL